MRGPRVIEGEFQVGTLGDGDDVVGLAGAAMITKHRWHRPP